MSKIHARRVAIVTIASLGLLVAVAVSAAARGDARPKTATVAAPAAYAALPAQAYDTAGVRLLQHDMTAAPLATIGTQSALTAAADRIGTAVADAATSVRVTFGDFSDDEYFTTLADGSRDYVAQGVPAFVVTYEGVAVPLNSPSAAISNTEENVVVNAVTGQVIEVFSFQ